VAVHAAVHGEVVRRDDADAHGSPGRDPAALHR
jgi:hypothetical protein